MAGKIIIGYGDFDQLYAVGHNEPFYANKTLINYIFNKDNETYNEENHRNNIPLEYYKKLINKKLTEEELIKEMRKYSTKEYLDAEYIIGYTNKERDTYNKLKCKQLNIKNKTDIGTRVICNFNKEYTGGIILNNKDTFIVDDVTDTDITLKYFKTDKKITVSLKIYNTIFNKYNKDIKDYEQTPLFDYGYAVTLHSVQGKTIKSYYLSKDSEIPFSKMHGAPYTLISRLKGDIYKDDKKIVLDDGNLILGEIIKLNF